MTTSGRTGCRVDEHVGALGDAGGLRVLGAVDDRQVLARERDAGRAAATQDLGPRLRGLVGVGRADDGQARHRPQRGEVLDRLVRRAVLAEADASRGSTRR